MEENKIDLTHFEELARSLGVDESIINRYELQYKYNHDSLIALINYFQYIHNFPSIMMFNSMEVSGLKEFMDNILNANSSYNCKLENTHDEWYDYIVLPFSTKLMVNISYSMYNMSKKGLISNDDRCILRNIFVDQFKMLKGINEYDSKDTIKNYAFPVTSPFDGYTQIFFLLLLWGVKETVNMGTYKKFNENLDFWFEECTVAPYRTDIIKKFGESCRLFRILSNEECGLSENDECHAYTINYGVPEMLIIFIALVNDVYDNLHAYAHPMKHEDYCQFMDIIINMAKLSGKNKLVTFHEDTKIFEGLECSDLSLQDKSLAYLCKEYLNLQPEFDINKVIKNINLTIEKNGYELDEETGEYVLKE